MVKAPYFASASVGTVCLRIQPYLLKTQGVVINVVSVSGFLIEVHLSVRCGFDCVIHRNALKSWRKSWFFWKSYNKTEYVMLSLNSSVRGLFLVTPYLL